MLLHFPALFAAIAITSTRACTPGGPTGPMQTVTATVRVYPLLSWLYASSGATRTDISPSSTAADATIKASVLAVMEGALRAAGIDPGRVMSYSATLPPTEVSATNCVLAMGLAAFRMCTGGQTGNVATCGGSPTGCADLIVSGNFIIKIRGVLTNEEKMRLQTGLYEMIFAKGIFLVGAPTIIYQ
uniref:Uncharacterized protein n=2 Tax=Parascaris TaxID=6254 RepID=A0A915C980_PARUN